MNTAASEQLRPAMWVQPLDAMSCWARIAQHGECRMRIQTGAGLRSLVTPYQVLIVGTVMGIVLALPRWSSAFQYGNGRIVTVEIDGHDDDGGSWVVRVVGLARGLPDDYAPDDGWDEPRWSNRNMFRFLYIPGHHIGGSVVHPLASQRDSECQA